MNEVTRQQVIDTLQALGVQPGDGLLVHSALQFLGRPAPEQDGLEMYLEALCTAVGCEWPSRSEPELPIDVPKEGTIAVPTFNFAFARGEPYDPETTPSIGMGAFSEFVRRQPGARRTSHPLQSLAVIGKVADDLAGRDTLSAFDAGSAFERMVELNFKILLLGADIDAISLIHYSEQRQNVPYRYWKDFTGKVKVYPHPDPLPGVRERSGAEGGVWEDRTYRMYVRDLDLDPHLTLHPVGDEMIAKDLFHSVPLNYGQVSLLNMADFVPIVDRFLADDPFSLMK